jgi:N-acetylglucosaminyldiphosphoundecaprenol N-acetyl-beta-D-mannosaminyltransferase
MLQNNERWVRISHLLKKTEQESGLWNIDKVDWDTGFILSFLNAHAINMASKNQEFYEVLLQSRFLLRDGIGVKIAMKLFRLNAGQNLNGTDLISKIIPRMLHKNISIFGASTETLDATHSRLKTEGVNNIIDLQHGFHDFNYYLGRIEDRRPDLIILCMGMPKQELLAIEIYKKFPEKIIVCGGGWADFYSGIKKRAPLWVQKLSCEWIYRLCHEPKRLGKRYTIDLIYFFCVIFMARLNYKEK